MFTQSTFELTYFLLLLKYIFTQVLFLLLELNFFKVTVLLLEYSILVLFPSLARSQQILVYCFPSSYSWIAGVTQLYVHWFLLMFFLLLSLAGSTMTVYWISNAPYQQQISTYKCYEHSLKLQME